MRNQKKDATSALESQLRQISSIDEINNIRINAKSIRWSSDRLDGAVVGSFFGTPSQTKVMRM